MAYLLAFGQYAQAQSISNTDITSTVTGQVDIVNGSAQLWGISDSDWSKYKALMTGEAKLHYSHLEPAFVLGIYAETDAERTKYAEMVYKQQEKKRLSRLFAFNRSYMKHTTARDGDKPLINAGQVAERESQLQIPTQAVVLKRVAKVNQ